MKISEIYRNERTQKLLGLLSLYLVYVLFFKSVSFSSLWGKFFIDKYDLICWRGIPRYNQLQYILSLGWSHLLKPGETTRPMTIAKLVKVTFDYGKDQNILRLVQENIEYMKNLDVNMDKEYQELLDNAIKESFQILKHWFQYKVPKWLSVINNLQQYVCKKKGLTR